MRDKKANRLAVCFAAMAGGVFGVCFAAADTRQTSIVAAHDVVDDRDDGSGAFRTHCLESHASNDDPLVFPGAPGKSHHHIFFGNTGTDAATTVKSLMEAGEATCDGGVLNRSAYWVPALYDAHGERIKYDEPLFYYKSGYHVPASSIKAPPEGLTMIAGHAHAVSPQGTHVVRFRCSSWRSDRVWFEPGDPLDHVDYLPDCPTDDLLEMRVVFPQCWDGVNLSSPDNRRHMAYPIEATPPNTGTGRCPPSHPVALPEITYHFEVYVTRETGPSSAWRFSSDRPEVSRPGVSFHGDWMNGWKPQIMNLIVENCIRPARECGVGLLGNGKRLRPVVTQ